MIKRSIDKFRVTMWQSIVVGLALFAVIACTAIPAQTSYAATTGSYSCGAYGQGSYSAGGSCAGSTVGAPNTGFGAKLLEPANLATIIGSLLLLTVGVGILLKVRSRKKQDVAFDQHTD
jgi:hypothetical protein